LLTTEDREGNEDPGSKGGGSRAARSWRVEGRASKKTGGRCRVASPAGSRAESWPPEAIRVRSAECRVRSAEWEPVIGNR
jgi:hypothetical protein